MHVIPWEFTVAPDRRDQLIAAYKADGLWAQLFGRAEGYGSTELLFSEGTGRFVTLDRWKSASAFQEFQARFSEEYILLDANLESLMLSEMKLGSFEATG